MSANGKPAEYEEYVSWSESCKINSMTSMVYGNNMKLYT